MKKIFLLVLMLTLLPFKAGWCTGVFNGTGTVSADSITIPFLVLDSSGNMVALASGDSLYIQIQYPEGAQAYEDSGSYDGTGLDGSLTSNTFSTGTMYYYSESIDQLVGTDVNGVYTYAIVAKDLTGAALFTPNIGTFQLYTNADYNIILDSAGLAAKYSAQALDSLADVLDSLETQSTWIQDSLYAIIDSIQIKWVNRTGYDPATDSVIVDVSSATTTDGLAGHITDSLLDEVNTGATHNVNASLGKQVRQGANAAVLTSGTAQASGTPTDPGKYLILAAATAQPDDFFNSAIVTIDGGTGVGQARSLFDYTGATDSAALHAGDDWITDPDATSTYIISAGHPVEVIHLHNPAIDDIWEYPVSSIGTADGIGDSLMSLGDTTISNNKEAFADAVLDSLEAGTARDIKMKSLVISNSAGDAVRFVSTGNNGDGLYLTAHGTGYGLKAHSGNGATGDGILAKSFSANGSGLRLIGGGIGDGLISTSGFGATGNGVQFTAQSTNGNGIGLTATGTGVEITGDDLVDLFWNEDSTGHYTDPQMAYLASQTGASGGISDADMIAIKDTILGADTTSNNGVAGSYGQVLSDPSYVQGAASGLTKEDVADAVMDSLEAGTARDIKMKSLVVSNSAGTAVLFRSTGGNGQGLDMQGNGSGHGRKSTGGATGFGSYDIGGATSGDGYRAVGSAAGWGARYIGGTTNGFGGGLFTSIATNGLGLSLIGLGTSSALSISSAGTTRDVVGILDSANFSQAVYDTIANYVTYNGLPGDTMVIVALDTLDTDSTVQGTAITITNLAGLVRGFGLTDANGEFKYSVNNVPETLYVTGQQLGYTWAHMGGQNVARADTIIITSGGGSDTLVGSNVVLGSSATANTATVTVQVTNPSGAALAGIKVEAMPASNNVADSAGHAIPQIKQTSISDASGNAAFECVWSAYMIPETKWRFKIYLPGGGTTSRDVTITYGGVSQTVDWSVQ